MPLHEPINGPRSTDAKVTDALIELISEAVLRALRRHSQEAELPSAESAIGPRGLALLTAGELAELLALPERRIYELAKRGDIPVVNIGRQVRFRKEAVAAWIERKESGASGQRLGSGE